MRLLGTGSRDWDDFDTLFSALREVRFSIPWDEELTVVHGACKSGADALFAEWVATFRQFNITEERHPAIWRPYGIYNPQAGMVRNQAMVDLGADLALTFIKNGSRGASHCAAAAERAGIPTRRYTQ